MHFLNGKEEHLSVFIFMNTAQKGNGEKMVRRSRATCAEICYARWGSLLQGHEHGQTLRREEEEGRVLCVFQPDALQGRVIPTERLGRCADEGNVREIKKWWQPTFKLSWAMIMKGTMLKLGCVHHNGQGVLLSSWMVQRPRNQMFDILVLAWTCPY